MLKLSVPTLAKDARFLGQVAYGVADLMTNGNEMVAQKWVAIVSDTEDKAVTCVNDGVHGSDFSTDGLRMTLLRSPGYSAHPLGDRTIVPQDRFTPRIDQGERFFRFWINAGSVRQRLDAVDREALAHNENPFALSFYPSGSGSRPLAGVTLSDPVVQMGAVKKAEDGNSLIVRLFEPTGNPRSTTLSVKTLGLKKTLRFKGFEIRSFRVDLRGKSFEEVDILEHPIEL